MSKDTEDCTPGWLKRLSVEKIALVDQGANPEAVVTLYKSRDLPAQVGTIAKAGQSKIFEGIAKGARKLFPGLSGYDAIARYIETEEGQQLALRHSQAEPDFEPEEFVSKAEFVGGDQGALIAKRLDDAASEYMLLHGCSKGRAYDKVLASSEGRDLREKYDTLVRS
jgi:hypothetical protein